MYKWLWNALGWLALCIILPIVVVYGGLFSFSREVPDVSGMSEARALAELDSAGFRGWVNYVQSAKIPEGYTVKTYPEGGDRLWPKDSVRVDVSLGAQLTEVPKLIGETYGAAQTTLVNCGLKYEIEWVYSDGVEKGRVISQSILDGNLVPFGTTIYLEVSAGLLSVPELVNMDVYDAIELLEKHGLAYRVDTVASEKAKNTVASQFPAAGTWVSMTQTVTLKVSQGVFWVEVPDLGAQRLASARALAQRYGFDLTVRYAYSDTFSEGCVISQEPEAGREAPRGSSIAVTVNAVPAVVGTTPANALNYGVAVTSGDWTYFTNFNKDFYLYKMRRDGSDKQVLLRESVHYVNVVGEWIYFSSMKKINGQYAGLSRIRTDGTGLARLRSGYDSWVYVENDWIYYLEGMYPRTLGRIRTDGTDDQLLCGDEVWQAVVVETGIYYTTGKGSALYFMEKDGSGKRQIAGSGYSCLAYDEGYLFCLGTSVIIRIDIFTGEVKHSEDTGWNQRMSLASYEGWLYYRKYPNGQAEQAGIYKMRYDLTEETKVCDLIKPGNTNVFLVVDDGWVYFANSQNHDYLYRVKTDGSVMEPVYK